MTIKELRISKKLTQAQMARLIGVNQSCIGHLENGRMQISDALANKIWTEFGVDVSHESKEKREQIAGQSLSAPDKEAEHGKRCPEKYVKILNKRHKRLLSVSVEIDKT